NGARQGREQDEHLQEPAIRSRLRGLHIPDGHLLRFSNIGGFQLHVHVQCLSNLSPIWRSTRSAVARSSGGMPSVTSRVSSSAIAAMRSISGVAPLER